MSKERKAIKEILKKEKIKKFIKALTPLSIPFSNLEIEKYDEYDETKIEGRNEKKFYRLKQNKALLDLIKKLKNIEGFSFRPYNCTLKTLDRPIIIVPEPVTIIEGSYSLHPFFGDYADLRIFMDISPEEQKKRLKARNECLLERFENEWIPMEERYFNEFKIREKCDFIFR